MFGLKSIIKKLVEKLKDKRGAFDISSVMDTILMIVLLPALLNTLTSLTGTTIPGISDFLNVFTQILPIVLIFNILSDLFSGFSKGLGKFFDYILMIVLLPTLINTLTAVTGTTIPGLTDTINLLTQLIPVLAIFELISDMLGRKRGS